MERFAVTPFNDQAFLLNPSDLNAAVANISKKKLQGVVLTADKVREADAILVTGKIFVFK